MMTAERFYRLLLRAYPARFRRLYEHEMILCFRDQRRHDGAYGAHYWFRLVADVAQSAPHQWRDALMDSLYSGEAIMKAMAVAAMLVGGMESYNAFAEASAGGFGGRSGLAQVGLVLAILTGVLLVVAGIAMLRQGREATAFARIAGLAMICSFAFVGIARPMLSGISMLLGIGFPIVLLVFLFAGRNNGPSRAV